LIWLTLAVASNCMPRPAAVSCVLARLKVCAIFCDADSTPARSDESAGLLVSCCSALSKLVIEG
jgi:hypothetical protein